MVRYEYAITAGPGTLIGYGTCNKSWRSRLINQAMWNRHTIILARAAENCETGK